LGFAVNLSLSHLLLRASDPFNTLIGKGKGKGELAKPDLYSLYILCTPHILFSMRKCLHVSTGSKS
jgi:hypothetical protein